MAYVEKICISFCLVMSIAVLCNHTSEGQLSTNVASGQRHPADVGLEPEGYNYQSSPRITRPYNRVQPVPTQSRQIQPQYYNFKSTPGWMGQPTQDDIDQYNKGGAQPSLGNNIDNEEVADPEIANDDSKPFWSAEEEVAFEARSKSNFPGFGALVHALENFAGALSTSPGSVGAAGKVAPVVTTPVQLYDAVKTGEKIGHTIGDMYYGRQRDSIQPDMLKAMEDAGYGVPGPKM